MQAMTNWGSESEPAEEFECRALIENHFHFIWFGHTLPDYALVAIRSALVSNPGATATLWHSADLREGINERELSRQGLALKTIVIDELLSELASFDTRLNVSRLRIMYSKLSRAQARANVIRMLVLYLYGGVYLDTDTLTQRDMAPLRRHGAFCGKERTFAAADRSKLNLRGIAVARVGRVLSTLPFGHRADKHLGSYCSEGESPAVLGAEKGHPLLFGMLSRMLRIPALEWTRQSRLGKLLLQQTLRDLEDSGDLDRDSIRVLEPQAFYPVGPKLSQHYFRRYRDASVVAEELVSPETYVVHWYAGSKAQEVLSHHHTSESTSVFAHLSRQHLPAVRSVPSFGRTERWGGERGGL